MTSRHTTADNAVGRGLAGHVCLTFWGNLNHDARAIRTAASLAEAGLRVSVICTDPGSRLPAVEQHPAGFSVRRIRRPAARPLRVDAASGRARIGAAGALWAALRGMIAHVRLAIAAFRCRADIYHAADLVPLPATWLVARLLRRPVVYEAYEISTDRGGFRPVAGLIARVEGFLARRVEQMFATTGMRADHFAKAYGIARPHVLQNRPPFRRPLHPPRESPPGSALGQSDGQSNSQSDGHRDSRPHGQLDSEPGATNRLRRLCGIPAGVPIVLYQGGLQPGRGLLQLIDAAARVEDARFVLLGAGVLADTLRQRISALRLGERVYLLPAVPASELHEWTCSADIGVQILENTCLNHYTTDSNKLFEYIMAGLPVVASDFPEIRSVVASYDVGVLVDPADLDAITAAISRLVRDGDERARLRANALRAAPELSWETQVPTLLDAYRPLLPSAGATSTASGQA